MKDEGGEDQCEAGARRHERDEHRGREDRQNDERSTPRHTPRALGYVPGLRASQDGVLESVVRNISTPALV
jgi:hypothetical protein